MSSPRLLIRDLTALGTLAVSPAALSTLPIGNLLTQPRNEVWRSPGVTTQVITVVFGSNQTASMVALARLNATTGGTVQVQGYDDAGMTSQLFNSTALAAFSTASLADVDAFRYLEDSFRGKKNFVYYFTKVTTLRAIKITITDAGNPAGYIEASRLFIGDYFEFTYEAGDSGESGASRSLTVQGRSEGGDLWSDRGPGYEQQTVDLDNIHEDDVPELLALSEFLGTHTDFFFDLLPGDTSAFAIYRRGQRKFTAESALRPRGYMLNAQTLAMESP